MKCYLLRNKSSVLLIGHIFVYGDCLKSLANTAEYQILSINNVSKGSKYFTFIFHLYADQFSKTYDEKYEQKCSSVKNRHCVIYMKACSGKKQQQQQQQNAYIQKEKNNNNCWTPGVMPKRYFPSPH